MTSRLDAAALAARTWSPVSAGCPGAEAALVVNNNAAAMFLALAGIIHGGEVPISRGELVEIGGFRVPDIMSASGAILREVGTTNRTYARDYAAAVSEHTKAILRVHQSNFRCGGFSTRPTCQEPRMSPMLTTSP